MAKDDESKAKDDGSKKKAEANGGEGLWAGTVGAMGAMMLMVYQAVMAIILIFLTVRLLRNILGNPEGGGNNNLVIILVIVLGALGAQIRCVRSVWWYVGNRGLKRSWVPMYLLSPLVGSMLALVFFLLLRGGFVSMGESGQASGEIGLAGASALVGMFSDEASVKFKAIAQAIFSNVEKGRDSEPEKDPEPEPEEDQE